MKSQQFFPASQRGATKIGWLSAKHSFSFGDYYDPDRIQFGALRVINDDLIAPSGGFPTHGHQNMEIITLVLKGALAHKDSLGHQESIHENEVQVMSAGSGIRHSEFNPSESDETSLLQIWIHPDKKNVSPRYQQKVFDPLLRKNQFQLIVSPNEKSESLWIHQRAYISIIELEKNLAVKYALNLEENGVYFFLIEGEGVIDEQKMSKRDALALTGKNEYSLSASSNLKLLVLEVPLTGLI